MVPRSERSKSNITRVPSDRQSMTILSPPSSNRSHFNKRYATRKLEALLPTTEMLAVTGGGYGTLSLALSGGLAFRALLILCVFKLIATVFSYGSGGAGGIFAPALFIGGMLGGAFGYFDHSLFHHGGNELGSFALVGMGAVFAGIIRAPITSVLIIFEMTGSYELILPLMISNMTS